MTAGHVCVPGLCWAWKSALGLWRIKSEKNSTLGKGTWNNDQGDGRKGRDGEPGAPRDQQLLTSPAQRLEHTPTLTHGLEVECHHLTANIPKHLGLVIGGVHPGAFGVNAAHLPLVVSTGSIGNNAPLVPWGQPTYSH